MIDGLCKHWGCPPSVVLKEDASYVGRMMELIALGKPEEPDGS